MNFLWSKLSVFFKRKELWIVFWRNSFFLRELIVNRILIVSIIIIIGIISIIIIIIIIIKILLATMASLKHKEQPRSFVWHTERFI